MSNGIEPMTQSRRASVLVVDDDSSVRGACATMLARVGFSVSEAEDGEQAWEELRTARFQLVITDYSMPKLTGFELVRRMRGAGMTQPVIMISGTPDLEKQLGGSQHSIEVILPKPFSCVDLLNRVNAVLELAPPAAAPPDIHRQP
jgi:DNA-binding response OmpR family regulator